MNSVFYNVFIWNKKTMNYSVQDTNSLRKYLMIRNYHFNNHKSLEPQKKSASYMTASLFYNIFFTSI